MFSLATKLSSRIPNPKRCIVTVSVIVITNIIRIVKNLRRISEICLKKTIKKQNYILRKLLLSYQNMASTLALYKLSELVEADKWYTWLQQWRKRFWKPEINLWLHEGCVLQSLTYVIVFCVNKMTIGRISQFVAFLPSRQDDGA